MKESINLTETTTIPVSGYDNFKNDRIAIQFISSDISPDGTWTLQLSLDGENWSIAKNLSGDNIEGTITQSNPILEIIEGKPGILYRIVITTATEGIVYYILKN